MEEFDWAVIGAGPAGIAAVGKLLDAGINPNRLAWVDPAFSVGDFGTKWRNVSSNTKAGLFLNFLHACQSFHYADANVDFSLNAINPSETCLLHLMSEPLEWVTQQLSQTVRTLKDHVEELQLKNNHWNLTLSDQIIQAKQVVLAIGSEPKTLSYSGVKTIPLEVAMDSERLGQQCHPEDCIAVFGSSHSAVISLRNLIEYSSAKKVINFYRAPLRYAIDLGDEILFDDTGLKGLTAAWARTHLHGTPPEKLQRVHASDENIEHWLPHCNKAIYAVGFEHRGITITDLKKLEYNPYNGIIAPGLFGLGIAFPQAKIDRFGNLEYRVGLWKFMDYLSTVLPIWMKYSL